MSEKQLLNTITEAIIGAAVTVHHELGPGMLESIYEACLMFELIDRKWRVDRQVALPVTYRGTVLDCGFRIDLLVEDEVIVEVKAVESIHPVHRMQLLSYLRQRHCKVGLLLNFNVKWLSREGITRLVNGFPD
ncbi:MAG TPA: GxxExxY protein [Vicinamibacterales bacterium]|nr:GxxExxY protein [Vicinamibacterales bacterium]